MRDVLDLHHLRPIKQQVVVIEHMLPLFGLDISSEQRFQFGLPAGTPGEVGPQDLIER